MSANSRMSLAVHVLTWIAFDRSGTDKEVGTSQHIATSVNTNPVVIRRSLSELREAGLVSSSRSRGWALTRDASEITLLDVYCAVGGEEIFGLHSSPPDAECYVGYGIQPALSRVYERATAAMCESLAQTSISDILHDTMAESGSAGARAR